MGKRGPSAKPQHQKDLDGNPGKQKRPPDPVEADGLAVPPDWLTGNEYGMTVWHRVVKSMPDGFYKSADSEILASYCQAVDLLRASALSLNAVGILVVNSNGNLAKNPAHGVLSDAQAKMLSLSGKLGLDPATRQTMAINDQEKPKSKFGDTMSGKKGLQLVAGGKK